MHCYPLEYAVTKTMITIGVVVKALKVALRRTLISLLLVISPALWALNHWTESIFTPPRRTLQAYHQQRLQHPEQFALRIQKYACLQGRAPCLLVEPDARYISNVGKKVRQQVQTKGQRVPQYGKVLGTVVLLHGRKGRKEDLIPVAERYAALGLRCLLIDLPAHGESPLKESHFGATPFERSLPRLALQDAASHFKFSPQPAALWGVSMGGSFAVAAASENPLFWKSLVVVSSFDRLERIMLDKIPERYQFAGVLARAAVDKYHRLANKPVVSTITPVIWAQRIQAPTLIVHGDKDELIGMQQGKALYAAIATTQKRWLTVSGAGHRTVLTTPMPLYAEMGSWLLQHL